MELTVKMTDVDQKKEEKIESPPNGDANKEFHVLEAIGEFLGRTKVDIIYVCSLKVGLYESDICVHECRWIFCIMIYVDDMRC